MNDKICPWCKKEMRILFTLEDGLIVAKVCKLKVKGKMKEIDESDLEEEYEERILKEFSELINSFQKKHKMGNTSMIRLLSEQINQQTNQIDI